MRAVKQGRLRPCQQLATVSIANNKTKVSPTATHQNGYEKIAQKGFVGLDVASHVKKTFNEGLELGSAMGE